MRWWRCGDDYGLRTKDKGLRTKGAKKNFKLITLLLISKTYSLYQSSTEDVDKPRQEF